MSGLIPGRKKRRTVSQPATLTAGRSREQPLLAPVPAVPNLHAPQGQRRYAARTPRRTVSCDGADDAFYGLDDAFQGHAVRLPALPRTARTVDEQWNAARDHINSQYYQHLPDIQRRIVEQLQHRVASWPAPEKDCEQCSLHQQPVLVITFEGAFEANVTFRKCTGCVSVHVQA